MQKNILGHDSDQEETTIERRKFLKHSMLGGVATALFSSSVAYGMAEPPGFPEECQGVTAADLLALFSSLAWKLPNKLKAADEARDAENKVYKDFNTLYQELVDLAKQLKIKCDAVTQKDPRLQEIFELTNAGQNNVRYLQTASSAERDIAYMQLATLAVAARQVARSANEILPEKLVVADPDNKIICQMLEKINEMQNVKAELDTARKTSTDLFKDFRDSIGNLNKVIIDASDFAAKAQRGELGSETAVAKIVDAEKILDEIKRQSSPVQKETITPEQLRSLLAVPKAMLRNEIPDIQAGDWRQDNPAVFQTVGYIVPERAAAASFSRVARIISENIRPSGWWTVRLMATACVGILSLYREEGRRKPLIRNALQGIAWIDSNTSNLGQATSLIARIGL
ncbi:MAG: hypothetical protein ACKVQW_02525 [Pyrinomonadaceae bacterium]